MSELVLVLNASYAPIDVSSFKKAMKKVYKQKAEVIETYADSHLQTWKEGMEPPAIIRLLHFVSLPRKAARTLPFTRKNVWLRDRGVCQYCGKHVSLSEMSWDHVIPRAQGGKSNFCNIVASCIPCNRRKDCRTPEQAGMKLLSRPKTPTYTLSKEKEMAVRLLAMKNFPHARWRDYSYFNLELQQD